MKKDGEEIYIFPKLIWDFDNLKRIKQAQSVSFKISYKIDDQNESHTITSAIVNPINDILMFAPDLLSDKKRNYRNLFAAFVNEYDPLIENIKREALKNKFVDAFDGSQSVKGIHAQMEAIWRVLKKRGIKYSNYTTSMAATANEKMFSQRLRFLGESLSSEQANCADGSILFASIFLNIGLNPLLIIEPGHMYVAVYADGVDNGNGKKADILIPIETTMLSSSNFQTAEKSAMDKVNDFIKKHKMALKSRYISANDRKNILKHYTFIDVAECRKNGIYPIASTVQKAQATESSSKKANSSK